MYDPGYASYQDPRLQPPEEPEQKSCGGCDYYRPFADGACVFEVFQADTFEQLAKADLIAVDPTGEPCRDYREEERWASCSASSSASL